MNPTRIPRALASSVAALLTLVSTLPAADLFWDGGFVGPAVAPADGGTGTWTDGLDNWLNAAGTAQAWSNLTPDRAILGGTAGTVTLGSPITASGLQLNTSGYVLQGGGNLLTFANNAVISANYAATASTNLVVSLSGTNLVVNPLVANASAGLAGQGNVRISTNTAHTGTLTVSNGILEVASGVSLASSAAGVVINGSGIYHPNSATTHPFWQTRLGMLKVNGTGDAFGTQLVTLNGGTILRVSESGGNDMATIQNVGLNTGDNMLVSAPNGATAGDVLEITNLFRGPTATVQFRSSYGTLGAAGDNGSIRITNLNGVAIDNTNGIIGGWAFANSVAANNQGNGHASSFAAWSAALNSVVAAVPDKATNTGGVLNSQPLSTGTSVDNFLVNNTSTITADLTINSLIAQNDVIVNAAATLTLGSGGLIFRGGNFWMQSSENNGKITSGDAAGKLYLNVANTLDAAGDYRLRLQIVDNGATPLQLIKSGNGTIRLGQYNNGNPTNNSYTGGTIVQAGRLQTDAATALGTGPVTVLPGGEILFGNGGTFSNPFTLSGLGAPENAGLLGALRFSGNAEVSGPVTLAGETRIGSNAANDTGRITGPIAGTFNFEKYGAGSVTLSNTNSNFTGDVIVSQGTLVAQGSSGGTTTSLGLNSPTRTITVASGATLSLIQNNIFGGAGRNASELPTITVNNGTLSTTRFNIVGKVNLNGATMTEATTDAGDYFGYQFLGGVNAGGSAPSTIQSTNGTDNHLLGGGSINFAVADVTASAAADLTVSNGLRDGSGDYPGAGALVKSGAGTMVLAGANSYTGTTTVEGGALLINGTMTGSSPVSVLAGAALGGTGSLNGNVLVAGGAFVQAGDVTLASGALTLGAGLTLGDGSVLSLGLAAAGAHSSLVRTGAGAWVFDPDQAFFFPGFAMALGTYDNIISGLSADPVVSGWTILTPGVVGTFSYDGSGGVDLTLSSVPEPGVGMALLGGIGVVAGGRRRRRSAASR